MRHFADHWQPYMSKMLDDVLPEDDNDSDAD